jgi:hydrogenase nickel incorporation protein HypB
MCTNCGCSIVGEVGIHTHSHENGHTHSHENGHTHSHEHGHHHHHHHDEPHQTIAVGQAVLAKNDRLAERNRGYFMAKNLLVLNVLSSPGSGKTAFLERTIQDIGSRIPTGIIVGDLETDNDAIRLSNSGAAAVQITTGTVCHLESDMVLKAAQQLNLDALDVLVIENVGNLVCPAAYDLGEDLRLVLLSVTEGEDKPLKYPTMFKSAQVVIISKVDIAEAVEFDREKALENIRKIAPQAAIFEVSSRKGQGMAEWYGYLEQHLKKSPASAIS